MTRDLEIVWQCGNVCNAHCPYCINAPEAKKAWRNATLEETEKVIAAVNAMPVRLLHVLGGEPTCFEHIHRVVREVNCPEIRLSTNGIAVQVIAQLAEEANTALSAYLSVHPSVVEADPAAFRQRTEQLVTMAETGKLRELHMFMMIDGYRPMSTAFADTCAWLTTDPRTLPYVDASFVRRGTEDLHAQIVDLVHACSKAPSVVRKYLMGVRTDILRPNPWLGKRCPFFRHRFTLQLDGYMVSSDCPQKRISRRSVYDQAFNWADELITCTCQQPQMVCNGGCMAAHNVPKRSEVKDLQPYLDKW